MSDKSSVRLSRCIACAEIALWENLIVVDFWADLGGEPVPAQGMTCPTCSKLNVPLFVGYTTQEVP